MQTPSSNAQLRILIVDDHPITRGGLVSLIRNSWPATQFTEAPCLAKASGLLGDSTWDLVLLDNKLPDGTGLDFLATLPLNRSPILLFTMHDDTELAKLARLRGAKGFANKGTDPGRLLEVISLLIAGGSSFPEFHSDNDAPPLSPRERQVLKGILKGHSPTEIGRTLGISSQAVHSYKSRLLKKSGFDNLMELARSATERGAPVDSPTISRVRW